MGNCRVRTLLVAISCLFSLQQLFSATAPNQRTPAFFSRYTEHPVFIENRGQFDPRVRYQVRVHNHTIWLTDSGLTFDLVQLRHSATPASEKSNLPEVERRIFRAEFLHCLKPASIEHLAEMPGTYNFFSSDAGRSHSNVRGYSGVLYRGLWKGIDLKLYSKDGSNLEQEFIVRKGADTSQIRLRYEKVQNLAVHADGSLHIDTGQRELRESPPLVYATRKGIRTPVHGRFVLLGPTEYGFQVDSPADADELLIDPTLGFSTYLGAGSGGATYATGMEVDSAGYVYVTGTTTATDFPATAKFVAASVVPYPLSVYITKLSPDGARLIYSTLLEGAYNGSQGTYQATPAPNSSHVLALNTAGEVYVTGAAVNGFLSTGNAFQQCSPYYQFISKLNATGDQLLYSSCFGQSISGSVSGGPRFESIAANGRR